MANIMDYLMWRGDLSLERVPFCDVDCLILCRLAYVPFDGIVPEDPSSDTVRLEDAAARVLRDVNARNAARSLRIKEDERLLSLLAGSERFGGLRLGGYTNRLDLDSQEQFSAMSAVLPDGSVFVAFRGTDGTLVGWKEDFNMGFSDTVPAQLDAVDYLTRAAERFDGPIRVGGHSKGGNLAVYSAAFCPEAVQRRIIQVRNNDGPGFSSGVVASDGFRRIIGRTRTFLPQSSVVGMLLEHAEDFSIVHSLKPGILQHNLYSWEIAGGSFITAASLTNSSQFVDAALKDWVAAMSPRLRMKMIDGIYSVLSASDGKTLRDLWSGKSALAMIKAAGDMDEETRAVISDGLKMLRVSMKKSLPATLDRLEAARPPQKA